MLELLYLLKERLEYCSVAGISLISQDFKLKKIINDIEEINQKSPILEKIYNASTMLLQEGDKCIAVMDLLALINAVLITQGKTANKEMLRDIKSVEGDYKRISSKTLSRLYKATHETGGGRLEIINETLKDKEIASDFRVLALLIYALGDKYSEIPEAIVTNLIKQNADIIPLLKNNFDYNEKRTSHYKLKIISSIAKEKENDFYLDILSHEIDDKLKMEALHALRYDLANVNELVDIYATDEKSDLLNQIVWSLTFMGDNSGENYINLLASKIGNNKKKIYSDVGLLGDSEEILTVMLDDLEKQIAANNFTVDNKTTKKIIDSIAYTLNKQSDRLYDFYVTCLNSSEKFFQDKDMPQFANYFYMMVDIIADHVMLKNNDMTEKFVTRLEAEFGDKVLPLRFTLDLLNKDSDYVYTTYHKYIDASNKKTEYKLSTGIMAVFTRIIFDLKEQKHRVYVLNNNYSLPIYLKENLDDRWYKDILDSNVEMYKYFLKKGAKNQYIYDYNYIYNSLYQNYYRDRDIFIRLLKMINCKTKNTLNISLIYLFDNSIQTKLSQTVSYYGLENYLDYISKDTDNMLLNLINKIYSTDKVFIEYHNESKDIFEVYNRPYEEERAIVKLLISKLKEEIK